MNACGCVYSTQYLNTFLFTLDLIVLVCLEYEWAEWQIPSGCSAVPFLGFHRLKLTLITKFSKCSSHANILG